MDLEVVAGLRGWFSVPAVKNGIVSGRGISAAAKSGRKGKERPLLSKRAASKGKT